MKSIIVCSVIILLSMGIARAGWTILDMPGASETEILGIDGNNIVGDYYLGGSYHGFIYNGTTWTTIDKPGATHTQIYGIDGSNLVGTCSYVSYNITHGFIYNGSTWTTLDMPGARYTWIRGINGNNLVGSYYDDASGKTHAFLYNGSTWTTIDMPGARYTWIRGINGNNLVGTYIDDAFDRCHGFIYNGTIWTTIDYPGGGIDTEVCDIDGSNFVGSYYDNASDKLHGFIYNGLTWTTLDAPGAFYTYIYGIDGNNIVGTCYVGTNIDDFSCHGFIYTIPEPATPPIANADGPYTIFVGDTLTLDASGSTDDDNDIVSYLWDLDDNNSFETDAGNQPFFELNYAYLQSLGLIVDNTYNIHLKVTDSEGQSDVNDSTLTIIPIPALQVIVDIKPGSCPNPLNVKSSGVLPVAILGTADYDITTIDPTSIRLDGVEPLRNSLEDVAGPVDDSNDCNCTEDGPDGFLDLTLKFKTQKIVEAIGDVNEGDVLTLELTGVLIGERPIEGADCVLIRGKHKPCNKFDVNKDGVVDSQDFAIFAENWLQSSIVED